MPANAGIHDFAAKSFDPHTELAGIIHPLFPYIQN
jgi:hypothetical protein